MQTNQVDYSSNGRSTNEAGSVEPLSAQRRVIDSQPSRHQLASINQQHSIHTDNAQRGELSNREIGSINRITILLMLLGSIGIGTTIQGFIVHDDQLIYEGAYRTVKALGYVAITCITLIALQQMNQTRRTH